MCKLIILRGNSGSGKTTIAKELQRKIGNNTLLISQDVIRREMLMVKDGPDNMALPMLKELLIYGRNHCKTVILEGILVGEWYRSLFEQAKELYGKLMLKIEMSKPFAKLHKEFMDELWTNGFTQKFIDLGNQAI